MIPIKFFHDAIYDYYNEECKKCETYSNGTPKMAAVEAVSHRMIAPGVMLAKLSPGFGTCLVYERDDSTDTEPKCFVVDGLREY